MTEHRDSQFDPDRGNSAPQSVGARARAIADGELDDSAHAGVHDGSIEFERQLRSAVGRVMGAVETPGGLRSRVVDAVAASAEPRGATDNTLAAGLAARSDQTRSNSFWASHRGRGVGLALAAMVTLAAIGVFLTSALGPSAGISETPQAYRTQLAQYVVAEHARTSENPQAGQQKWTALEPEAARRSLRSHLGADLDVPRLVNGGVGLLGCGDCGVPGAEASSHMQFSVPTPDGGHQPVSLFVCKGSGDLGLEPGVTYKVNAAECGVPGAQLYFWVRGDLLYCLVSRPNNAGEDGSSGCDRILAAFGNGQPIRPL